MLHTAGVPMEPKPLAVGVRIEHRQSDIDLAQYKSMAGHPRQDFPQVTPPHSGPVGRADFSGPLGRTAEQEVLYRGCAYRTPAVGYRSGPV